MTKQDFDLYGMLRRRKMTLSDWIKSQDYQSRKDLERALDLMRVPQRMKSDALATWDTLESVPVTKPVVIIDTENTIDWSKIEAESLSIAPEAKTVNSQPKAAKKPRKAAKNAQNFTIENPAEFGTDSSSSEDDKNPIS